MPGAVAECGSCPLSPRTRLSPQPRGHLPLCCFTPSRGRQRVPCHSAAGTPVPRLGTPPPCAMRACGGRHWPQLQEKNIFSNPRSQVPAHRVCGWQDSAGTAVLSPRRPAWQRRAGGRWTGRSGMSPALSLLLSLATCTLLRGKSGSGAAAAGRGWPWLQWGRSTGTTLRPAEGAFREEGTE